VVIDLAAQKQCSPTQLSIGWILRRPGVSSVVLGVRNSQQLQVQLGAVAVEFSDEELARLDDIAPPGRATVPYYLDDDFADWSPALHRW
jgi:aryl-alcohol dehydrogenase-like predicted oxidoreductase